MVRRRASSGALMRVPDCDRSGRDAALRRPASASASTGVRRCAVLPLVTRADAVPFGRRGRAPCRLSTASAHDRSRASPDQCAGVNLAFARDERVAFTAGRLRSARDTRHTLLHESSATRARRDCQERFQDSAALQTEFKENKHGAGITLVF